MHPTATATATAAATATATARQTPAHGSRMATRPQQLAPRPPCTPRPPHAPRPPRRPRWLALGLAGALAGVLACASAMAQASATAATAADPLAKVQALIGDAACRSDADCQTLPVGRRACGGPAQYLPWSAWRSSGKALNKAAAPTLKTTPAGTEGMMGSCQVLVDPGARCQRAVGTASSAPGRCVLRQAFALPPVR